MIPGGGRAGWHDSLIASASGPGHIESLVRDLQPAVNAAKSEPGNPLDNTIAANARLIAARIKQDASLGDLAKDVRILPAVYILDSGKVPWLTN